MQFNKSFVCTVVTTLTFSRMFKNLRCYSCNSIKVLFVLLLQLIKKLEIVSFSCQSTFNKKLCTLFALSSQSTNNTILLTRWTLLLMCNKLIYFKSSYWLWFFAHSNSLLTTYEQTNK